MPVRTPIAEGMVHRFHHPGRPEDGVGDAKFVTLWQNKDGVWKVTRVISYNHDHGLLAKYALILPRITYFVCVPDDFSGSKGVVFLL